MGALKAAAITPPAVVQRAISNDTYLRRLHLSPAQTMALLPGFAANLSCAAFPAARRRAEAAFTDLRFGVTLVNSAGARWPAVYECVLSANGQLHCRLVGGWAAFCKANGVCLRDEVVLRQCAVGAEGRPVIKCERVVGK